MTAVSRNELLRQIVRAGGCSHPIRLAGDVVNLSTGEVGRRNIRVACKDRRAIVCPACSYLYKADAWILVASGLNGGKAVPESIASHPRLFMTLTAPSFGPVHTRRQDASCRAFPAARCSHGGAMSCFDRHENGSPRLGTPLCPDCFDYEGAVLWNAQVSRLWNRTIEQVRRQIAISQGRRPREFNQLARLSYLKVAEFQRRGLLHFHVVLRADGPGDPFEPPPEFLDAITASQLLIRTVASFGIEGIGNSWIHWGQQFDISDASQRFVGDLRIAAYLAKYSTKTIDDTLGLARRFHSRIEIDSMKVEPHFKRLASTAWDLARRPELELLNLRSHAHAFGYTGQLITKSRFYSTTFHDLREARALHMASQNEGDPVAGTFSYDGRGYDDSRAAEIAQLLHEAAVEVRQVTRTANSVSHGISHGTSHGEGH
jgi:hypothetical protein